MRAFSIRQENNGQSSTERFPDTPPVIHAAQCTAFQATRRAIFANIEVKFPLVHATSGITAGISSVMKSIGINFSFGFTLHLDMPEVTVNNATVKGELQLDSLSSVLVRLPGCEWRQPAIRCMSCAAFSASLLFEFFCRQAMLYSFSVIFPHSDQTRSFSAFLISAA